MQSFLINLRHGTRRLAASTTFTIICVLTLALGVGANTAIVSVIQAVLLNPAGVHDPGSLVSFHTRYIGLNLPSIGVSAPDFADALAAHAVVASAALSNRGSANATIGDRSLHVDTALVSWQWFQVFGARPILGRGFVPEDDHNGANHVVVLSYSGWQRLLGGEKDAVGKTLTLDQRPYRIIGVMRSDFDWPSGADLWMPLALAPASYAPTERFNEYYDAVVRLRPAVTVEQFNRVLMQKVFEEVHREGRNGFGESSGWGMFAQSWTEDAAGSLRKPLFALLAAAFGVLLIACANIAGLMVARTIDRAREFAIRTALGASATDIATELICELLLLAGVATAIAVASTPIFGRLLLLAIPHDLAMGFAVRANPELLFGAAALGLLAAVLSGMAPVLQVIHRHTSVRLAEYRQSSTAGLDKQRLRSMLVGSQIVLAFVLLAGTGMFLTSLKELQRVDPGFRASGVLTGYVGLSDPAYQKNNEKKDAFVEDVLSRIGQQAGITAAAAVFPLPFGNTVNPSGSFEIENLPVAPGDPGPHSDKRWATPSYLAAMKVPLLRGRWFSNSDRASTQPVAVIDDTLARAYWPNRDPIGQRLRSGNRNPWVVIVGVVGHVRRDSLEVDENKGVIYRPFAQEPPGDVAFVVRTAGEPGAMRDALSGAVHAADPAEAIYNVRTLESLVSESLAGRHLLVWLLSAFGAVALLVAAIGLYGLLSYTVSVRTAEIGIRMALGAQRSQVVAMILSNTLRLIGAGVCAGLAAGVLMHKILAHAFAAMDSGMLSSLALATVGLSFAAALAALFPAVRSASVDPAVALRRE